MKSSVFSLIAVAAAVSAKTVSTVYETEHYTITSCAPTVTDCVAHETSTVHTYTTECDDDETATHTPYPTATHTPEPHYTTSSEVEYEVSTVYETKEYTITSCAPTVTACPYGKVTSTVETTTTLCPVTDKHYPTETHTPYPSETHVYENTDKHYPTSSWVHSYTSAAAVEHLSTVTISTCVPTHITKVITVTAGTTDAEKPYGTAAPTKYQAPNNGTLEYTGSASATKAGGLLMAFGLVAALL